MLRRNPDVVGDRVESLTGPLGAMQADLALSVAAIAKSKADRTALNGRPSSAGRGGSDGLYLVLQSPWPAVYPHRRLLVGPPDRLPCVISEPLASASIASLPVSKNPQSRKSSDPNEWP